MYADRCRFAPSTTGRAHPGTLLAALLAWLDARARSAQFLLRLEDVDAQRCRPAFGPQMVADLGWLGIDFDTVCEQHTHQVRHQAALETLAAAGLLYPCRCSRAEIREHARPAADGGFAYPGTCRERVLASNWRTAGEALRFRLPHGTVSVSDESGMDLSQKIVHAMGDPIVRRRDGAIAYQLAVVVDDAAAGVTRIVRGRDIAASTATQVALQRALGLPTPTYRHHLLLLEPQGDKLAKLHGSVGADELRGCYEAEALVGLLAHAAGLRPDPRPSSARSLLADFDWRLVGRDDRVVTWDGRRLLLG